MTVTFPKMTGDSSRDTRQLYPTCQIILLAAMADCVRRGIPIMCGEIQRSNAAQHRDFLNHLSKLDAGMSMHQRHSAVDTFTNPKKTGGATYHRPTLKAAAMVFKSYGVIWGGDWDNDGDLTDNKFDDWPHFQFCTLAEQDDIRKMTDDQCEAFYKKKFAAVLKRIEQEKKKKVVKK